MCVVGLLIHYIFFWKNCICAEVLVQFFLRKIEWSFNVDWIDWIKSHIWKNIHFTHSLKQVIVRRSLIFISVGNNLLSQPIMVLLCVGNTQDQLANSSTYTGSKTFHHCTCRWPSTGRYAINRHTVEKTKIDIFSAKYFLSILSSRIISIKHNFSKITVKIR